MTWSGHAWSLREAVNIILNWLDRQMLEHIYFVIFFALFVRPKPEATSHLRPAELKVVRSREEPRHDTAAKNLDRRNISASSSISGWRFSVAMMLRCPQRVVVMTSQRADYFGELQANVALLRLG